MPRYRLNPTEQDYLADESVPQSYQDYPYKLERRIEARADALPQRFEHLFDDVRRLRKGGYLHGETYDPDWTYLFDAVPHTNFASYTPPSTTGIGVIRESPSAAEWWGARLGKAVARSTPRLQGEPDEEVLQELLWGVMKGMRAHPDEEITLEFVRETTNMLSERAANEMEFYQGRTSSLSPNPTDEHIRTALDDAGIEPNTWAVQYVKRHLTEAIRGDVELMESRAANPDWAADEEIADVILSIANDRHLRQKLRLVEALREDMDRLEQKTGRGVTGEAVFLEVVGHSGARPPGSKTIAGELDAPTGGVTLMARDLAGRPEGRTAWEEHGIDVWVDRPILAGTRDGWEPTAYGTVLGLNLEKPHEMGRLHPLRRIPDETIAAAIAETQADAGDKSN